MQGGCPEGPPTRASSEAGMETRACLRQSKEADG
jgi:hypothetical protein